MRAYRDLRFFLAQRQPYGLGFLVLAIAITGFFVFAFMRDSSVPVPYKPNIIYVEQWPVDRTDAEIVAQQKIDQAAKEKVLAAREAERKKNQATFKRLDDKLNRLGI